MSGLERYARARGAVVLREEPRAPRRAGELELQARFYAGEFGLCWRGEGGASIEIVHPGQWNREPGPDFTDAVVRVDGRERRGHIELDREAADWERHGHALNPAFSDVVLHAFFSRGRRRFFTRNLRNEEVPQVCLGDARPGGAGTPRARGVSPGPASIPPGRLGELVEAAAEFRMARKREAWLRAVELHGVPEALFQAVAAGMGYKNNKLPFLLVAQRVGLRRAAGSGGEALLFGVAGFLERLAFDSAAPAVRSYARGLWEQWWAVRGGCERLILPREAWSFAALRPVNHPHRRMGALAAAVLRHSEIERAVAGGDVEGFLGVFENLHHSFWSERFSLEGERLKRPAALVGRQRAADLAANILAPARPHGEAPAILRLIPAGSPSGRVRRCLEWLGVPPAAAREWTRTALGHQGLLQLMEDFHPRAPREVLALFDSEGQESG